jgi:pyruvate dehydrogenase E2 component (dihydrolipoamide acetyltransferase)
VTVELRLPDIGEGLTEAEIVRWLVDVGERVREDQAVVEIQTDKAVTEMPAPASGVVAVLGAQVGEVIHVGDVLIVIDDGRGSPVVAGASATVPTASAAPTAGATPSPVPADDAAARRDSGRPKATPATRGLARRLGVDLSVVAGTGPGGRITDADVEATGRGEPSHADGNGAPGPTAARTVTTAVPPGAPARPRRDDERIPFRGVRRRTAETLTASWQQVPHVSSFAEVDVTDLFDVRQELKAVAEERGVALTLTAFFVKATALALRRVPMMNASLDVDAAEIVVRGHRNVAVAVNTVDGLVLPVVTDADTKSVLAIARELQELTARARDRSLELAAMTGSTFTVSNYGPLGGWFGTSLVRPGETGVLGFGPAPEKPAVVDGQIAIRRIMVLNGGADHRVVDGAEIIGFVVEVKDLLEHPLRLLVDE